MTPSREVLVSGLLQRCYEAYGDGSADIATCGNTVQTYLDPTNQRKYVAMYFAKFVGAWRWIRQALGYPADGPVWSIGAGPCLCLMGWFWDRPPHPQQDVLALDIAPWTEVRSLPEFGPLLADVCRGARTIQYDSPRFFPPSTPPQVSAAMLPGANPILSASIPTEATVVLPMVLNHLLGAVDAHPQPGTVIGWLQEVAARVRRVVIVDMPHDRTPEFWKLLWNGLGYVAPPEPRTFSFVPLAAEFSPLYPEGQGPRRTGLRYPQFCVLSGVVHDRATGRWQYFHNP